MTMTPPVTPMLLAAAVASLLYVIVWWRWWDVITDTGVELRYSEDEDR